LFGQEAFDNANARADRIDVPGSDFHARGLAGIRIARQIGA
jgi:hypothetical protein